MLAAIANLNLNLLTEVNHDVHHCVSIYMGREGFEPPQAEPVDLQSTSINHSDTYPRWSKRDIPQGYNRGLPSISPRHSGLSAPAQMATPQPGFEPGTSRLTVGGSTAELLWNKFSRVILLKRNRRFELLTSNLEGQRSTAELISQ